MMTPDALRLPEARWLPGAGLCLGVGLMLGACQGYEPLNFGPDGSSFLDIATTATETTDLPLEDEDHTALDALSARLYSLVSGPAEQPRDWAQYRSIFSPNAVLATPLQRRHVETFGVEEYIELYGSAFFEIGMEEHEVEAKTEVAGDLAHRWARCAWRWGEGVETRSGHSVVSTTFVRVDDEWLIASMSWVVENSAEPLLPPLFLSRK